MKRQVLEEAELPPPSKIFTSPMLRAVETANFVPWGIDSKVRVQRSS